MKVEPVKKEPVVKRKYVRVQEQQSDSSIEELLAEEYVGDIFN